MQSTTSFKVARLSHVLGFVQRVSHRLDICASRERRQLQDQVQLGMEVKLAAYVCGPKLAYTGTFLHAQLGFQKYKKCKFSTIMAEICNESHIV